jgi:hypothetical protein
MYSSLLRRFKELKLVTNGFVLFVISINVTGTIKSKSITDRTFNKEMWKQRRIGKRLGAHSRGYDGLYVQQYKAVEWSGGQSSWLHSGDDCASCEVRTEFIYVMYKKVDRLCDLVIRVLGYKTEMCCVSCEVRTEFIFVM